MASSDEEGEILPECVTDYEFVNLENQHISFAYLPLLWDKDEAVGNMIVRIYLSGTRDDGLEKIYKQVLAWRYELSYVQPEIWVLCKGKENHWVKLLKPKKLFEGVIRSILIMIHCLHFVKHNFEASDKSIWLHLSRFFSTYDVTHAKEDCMKYISFIRDAAKRDKDLTNSEHVLGILLEHPTNSKVHMEDFSVKELEFIVDEVEDDTSGLDDLDDEGEELFDTCCSICDNGGDILCCAGRCMRSFHATEASGEGQCESLGLSQAQVNAIPIFFCKNCQRQRHQCFICGMLGLSDITSNAEVFPCIAANCGRFYHPKCVAEEIQRRNDTQTDNIEKKIAAGESFVCPAHKCYVCKRVEDRKVDDLQFAVCRRCPKSYHRKCLPREISFENDYEKGTIQRAWDDLLPKRILIYCLDHEIIPELGTPQRNHINFGDIGKEKKRASQQLLVRVNAGDKKQKLIPSHSSSEKSVQRSAEVSHKVHCSFKGSESARPIGKGICRPSSDTQKKANCNNSTSALRGVMNIFPKSSTVTGGKSVLEKIKYDTMRNLKSNSVQLVNASISSKKLNAVGLNKPSIKKQEYSSAVKSNSVQAGNSSISCKKLNIVSSAKSPIKKQESSSVVDDLDVERRMTALMKEAHSSFNMDEFKKRQTIPSTYKNSRIDKSLTMGKVDVAVEAIRTALQKIDSGGTVDDAKAVCSPEMLRQLPLWKKKLEVYLAPFMLGTRYSSYGRHFTKMEKLQEVVDRLHWYVQDGDMIVDFCCGANEFSCLMKAKLDSVGKKCSFKNYDLFPSKNDFNFEQRDWFTVAPEELPAGSKLIMGLNPPFGVKAALANKFINRALQFRPKLLILIVPPETKRLDCKTDNKRYDLVWEDQHLLHGESFYLPGSIDKHDKQLSQWNNTTPPLSLWSRPDWTGKHMAIAKKCGHFWLSGQPSSFEPPPKWNYLMEEQLDCFGDFSGLMNEYGGDLQSMLDDVPEH